MLIKILSIFSIGVCVLFFTAGQTPISSPQLIIRPGATVTDAQVTLLHRIHFNADGSLVVLGSQGNHAKVWTTGLDEETSEFGRAYSAVRAAQWLGDREYLVASAAMQI